MATKPLDVVSLALMKQELRIGAREDSQDALLTDHIETGVGFVSDRIVAPLVEAGETVEAPRRGPEQPLCVAGRYIKRITAIRYWTPSAALRTDPDGEVMTATLGRQRDRDHRARLVWPPALGWPELLPASCFEVEVVRGIDITTETRALAKAVILCARQLYDGYDEIKPNALFWHMIKPWRSYSQTGQP